MNIKEAIKYVIDKKDLSFTEAKEVFNDIMSGNATDAQISAFIVALRMKGETASEIAGAASVMREKAIHVIPSNTQYLIDTCGTGGDNSNTFNISTAAAFVAAGSGARVAKHGNRSVSSKCGSADVLEALGVNINADANVMKKCLDEIGICFLFAPSLHKAMKYAIGPRKEIGIRTIFNILGPLTNPSLAKSQLLGVFSLELTKVLANVLNILGSTNAYVVCSLDNLDEITLTAETQISELSSQTIKTYTIKPEDFGFKRCSLSDISSQSIQQNTQIIKDILNGKKGPTRDIVVLNAGFAICASGIAKTPQEGIMLANQSIDTGKALEKLNKLIELTNQK
jgi:anthranilate phosphoribosyltransferase